MKICHSYQNEIFKDRDKSGEIQPDNPPTKKRERKPKKGVANININNNNNNSCNINNNKFLYSQDEKIYLFNKFCDLIKSSKNSARQICDNPENQLPKLSCLLDWAIENKVFEAQYRRARDIQAQIFFDEIEDILTDIDDTNPRNNTNIARLKIDTLKWKLGKMSPKRFNDKVLVELSGTDGDAIQISQSVDIEAVKRMRELIFNDIQQIGGDSAENEPKKIEE